MEQNYKVMDEKPAITPVKKPSSTKDKGKNAEESDDDGEEDDVDEPLESSDEEWSDEEEYCLVVSHAHSKPHPLQSLLS